MPEWWLTEEKTVPAAQVYMSFSVGPKSYIGEGFARVAMAAFAVLVGWFEIRLPNSNSGNQDVV